MNSPQPVNVYRETWNRVVDAVHTLEREARRDPTSTAFYRARQQATEALDDCVDRGGLAPEKYGQFTSVINQADIDPRHLVLRATDHAALAAYNNATRHPNRDWVSVMSRPDRFPDMPWLQPIPTGAPPQFVEDVAQALDLFDAGKRHLTDPEDVLRLASEFAAGLSHAADEGRVPAGESYRGARILAFLALDITERVNPAVLVRNPEVFQIWVAALDDQIATGINDWEKRLEELLFAAVHEPALDMTLSPLLFGDRSIRILTAPQVKETFEELHQQLPTGYAADYLVGAIAASLRLPREPILPAAHARRLEALTVLLALGHQIHVPSHGHDQPPAWKFVTDTDLFIEAVSTVGVDPARPTITGLPTGQMLSRAEVVETLDLLARNPTPGAHNDLPVDALDNLRFTLAHQHAVGHPIAPAGCDAILRILDGVATGQVFDDPWSTVTEAEVRATALSALPDDPGVDDALGEISRTRSISAGAATPAPTTDSAATARVQPLQLG